MLLTYGLRNVTEVYTAVVVAFSVKVPKPMESLAEEHNVKILSSSIIYRLVDNVTDAVIDLLPKTIVTNVVGEATILQTFEITAKGKTTKVAGCRVVDGVMHKTKTVRVVRQGKVVHEGMNYVLHLGMWLNCLQV